MEMTQKAYLTAQELAEMVGCSSSQAYKLIREINNKLSKQGYLTIKGKVSRYYVEQHWYGMTTQGGIA